MNNRELIPQTEWESKVKAIQQATKDDLDNHADAKKELSRELIRAVDERIPGDKFGVLFSGGIDSSLIALLLKKAGKDFTCYTLGFKNDDTKAPEDVEEALKSAKELGLNIKTKILDLKEAEMLIKKTAKILGIDLNNVVNVGVGGVVIGCIEMAKKDDVKFLFSGLGSEEIFAGYQRHKLAKDRQAECWKGLIAMHERDLLRDNAIANAENITLLTPFLDEKIIAAAMRVPAKYKMDDENSKIILREVAEDFGLSKNIAWRGKRAAQYGSRLDKAIDKLARKNKFKFKKDYLKSLN
ncbi:asparagine synthase C-terminal domain-containing protein [Candidatus Woesearchaeota archaeon]|nr:asparagine synthase C-terminal domain-containing protein [Candidatus Woesearchaeota archaeon]